MISDGRFLSNALRIICAGKINIPNYIFILTGFLAIYQLPVFSSRGTQ
jgi:hypothetical protein